MSEQLTGSGYEDRLLNRIDIAEVLNEFGEVKLKDIIDVDDKALLEKIRGYAQEWNIGSEDLLAACGIGEATIYVIEEGDSSEI